MSSLLSQKLARRGFLTGAASVAVIGFDPVQRTWLTEAKAGGSLSKLPRLDGELVTDAASLAEAADDFGHFIHRTPRAVLRPGSINDVVEMVRYAKKHRIKIAMRGQGHSTHGQAQVDAGIVIDSSTLASIQINANSAVVGPGARWREIIDASIAQGLTPPTLPNFIDITVGGNIAGGGIGGASHRQGAVVDNVLEMEVVTGLGQLRRCSAHENPALFNAVLGGLGQFGIVVKARIKLLPAKPMARMYTLKYADFASFLADVRAPTLDGRFDHLEAEVFPDANGIYKTVSMFGVKYYHPSAPPDDVALLDGLDPIGAESADMPYVTFLKRLDPIIDFVKSIGAWTLPHPWFDVFVSESKISGFVAETLSTITSADTGGGNVLLYPCRRSKFCRPFLRIPHEDEIFFLYDILAFAPPDPAVVAQMIARNTAWNDRATDLGGRRYNIGSTNMTREDWKRYFSPLWPAVVLAKLAFDPTNILTPGQGIFPGAGTDD